LSSVAKKNILKNGFEFKSKKIKNWGIDQLSRVQYKILNLRNWGIDQLSSVVKKKYFKKLIRILVNKIKELRNWPIGKGTI
jgi:hypothetical protein